MASRQDQLETPATGRRHGRTPSISSDISVDHNAEPTPTPANQSHHTNRRGRNRTEAP